jgi:hypothetical protein
MSNALKGCPSPQACLADIAIPQEDGVGTQEPEVVQRLHHGNAMFPGGVVHRRRNQRKGIVKVDYIRSKFFQQAGHALIGTPAPKGSQTNLQIAELRNPLIVVKVLPDVMPVLSQQANLVSASYVFAAGLLIEVVDHQDFHSHHFFLLCTRHHSFTA